MHVRASWLRVAAPSPSCNESHDAVRAGVAGSAAGDATVAAVLECSDAPGLPSSSRLAHLDRLKDRPSPRGTNWAPLSQCCAGMRHFEGNSVGMVLGGNLNGEPVRQCRRATSPHTRSAE